MSNSKRRRASGSDRTKLSIVNILLLLVLVLLSLFLIINLLSYNILTASYLNVLIPIVLILLIVMFTGLIFLKKAKLLTTVGLILMSLLLAGGLFTLKSVVDISSRMNESAKIFKRGMSVLVLKDSSIKDVSELSDVTAPKAIDGKNIDLLLAQISKDKGTNLNVLDVSSYSTAYQQLANKETQAIVMNSAYVDLLISERDDFESKVKEIYTYEIEEKVQTSVEEKPSSDEAFNVYISGIDTYGSISSVSRSDVNMIMTVNRKTNKILLTTTPRDSYVPIAGGGNNQPDKLTHAGIYGVDASIQTLENLYGIDINYYARINFTSFMTLIDLVGGVDVYNDQAFTAHTNKNYSFGVGNVHLDSQGALAFVRERYSLQNGDNDRGKNQQKVIAALINKLTSVNSVTNYNAILNGLGDAVQTDMELSKLMAMLNDQVASGKQYDVTTQTLTGTSSVGMLRSYAMPDSSLYMFSIDESSLANAKQAIQNIMEGN